MRYLALLLGVWCTIASCASFSPECRNCESSYWSEDSIKGLNQDEIYWLRKEACKYPTLEAAEQGYIQWWREILNNRVHDYKDCISRHCAPNHNPNVQQKADKWIADAIESGELHEEITKHYNKCNAQ